MRPYIRTLSDSLIAKILSEAKRVLATVGIEVRGANMRKHLLERGLPTNADGTRICFPPQVVDWAIQQAPRTFTLYNRDGLPHAEIGGNNVHFTPASSALKMLDHRTNQVRLANTSDFVEYVRVMQSLPNIAYLSTAFSTNDDIEADVSDVWRLHLCLTQSVSPVVSGAFTEHGVPRMAELMQLFRHDRQDLIKRPMSIFTITATGNFRYSEDSCQNLMDCVTAGIPIEIVPVTLMGLIAPVSIVGATVFHTVDVLAGLVMAQLVRAGAPVLFGGAPAAFHMKAATSPMLAIEALKLDLAYVEVAKHLGLPTQGYMAFSDSKYLDAQAGAETFGSALLAALAGVNSVSGPGMLDFVMVFSLPKLVLDNELCGQAHYLCRESHPLDDLPTQHLIDELLSEMHLITSEHTLKHWQNVFHTPHPVIDRTNRENHQRAGSPSLEQRAVQTVNELLAAYQPIYTDPARVAEMERIVRSGLSDPSRALPNIPSALNAPIGESTSRRRFRRS